MLRAFLCAIAAALLLSTPSFADKSEHGKRGSCCCGCNKSLIISTGTSGWADKADDDDGNNFGFTGAANATWLFCDDYGVQAGVRGGVFDIGGRKDGRTHDVEHQLFATGGFFKHADPYGCCSWDRASMGIVWDYFLDDTYGEMGDRIELHQLRVEAGYYVGCCDQLGFFGAAPIQDDTAATLGGGVKIKPIGYAGGFWQRDWMAGAHTRIGVAWADVEWTQVLLHVNGTAPISNCISAFGSMSWIPIKDNGDTVGGIANRYTETNWSVRVGFSYTFGTCLRNNCVKPLPLFDVAHNGTFLKKAPRGNL